jgi:subtilisin family serine protease
MWLKIFLLASGLLHLTFQAFSQQDESVVFQKTDSSLLEHFENNEEAEYIVLLKENAVIGSGINTLDKKSKGRLVFNTLRQHAEVTQKPLISFLQSHSVPYQSFYITNALKVTSNKDIMMALASRPDVRYILDNRPFYMLDYTEERTSSLRTGTPEWGLLNIKADSVWAMGITGEGVVIAGQDTGYEWELSPIKAKYRGYVNDTLAEHDFHWHDAIHTNNPAYADTLINPCGFSSRVPCDDHNHGTHTMGTMVGQDEENTIGVAPGARWIACRNMDRGWGQPSTYMECFEWFLAPYDYEKETYNPDMAPHVINNSWYCSETEGCNYTNFYLMENIVYNLTSAGIVVVASAGNTGRLGCGSVSGPPAFFAETFSVGATDINDTIGNFSSIGPVMIDSSFRLKPDVTAPGVGVRSIIRGGEYRTWNGTSMAGPHVAGAVALMISANPKLAGYVTDIENILRYTARPQASQLECEFYQDSLSTANPVYGHGIINVYEAVKMAMEFIPFSVENEIPARISVYPNPVQSHLVIRMEDTQWPLRSLTLYNQQGQILLHQLYDEDMYYDILDVQSYPAGMYFVKVWTDKGAEIKKIIKTE